MFSGSKSTAQFSYPIDEAHSTLGKMKENEKSWKFDNLADRYDRIVKSDSTLYERYDDVLDTVVVIANVSQGKRVLDIGTGTGNLALRCLARGAEVVGLDPSEKMLAKAKEKAGEVQKEIEKIRAEIWKERYAKRHAG